jgi:hypothetical protein
MDLKKELDCVSHDILLPKIENHEITGNDKKLLQSYLKSRYQRDLINNKISHNSTISNGALIKHGVPQGSILGLTLFLL